MNIGAKKIKYMIGYFVLFNTKAEQKANRLSYWK